MKILLTILPILFCVQLFAQYNSKGVLTAGFEKMLAVNLQTQYANSKPMKWYTITGTDGAIMFLFATGGYAQGWRDEWLYHPDALLERFGLQDNPYWNDTKERGFLNMQHDFDHHSKSGIVLLAVGAVTLKGFAAKRGRLFVPKNFWTGLLRASYEGVLYYGSYKLGHMLAWNVTHGNPMWRK